MERHRLKRIAERENAPQNAGIWRNLEVSQKNSFPRKQLSLPLCQDSFWQRLFLELAGRRQVYSRTRLRLSLASFGICGIAPHSLKPPLRWGRVVQLDFRCLPCWAYSFAKASEHKLIGAFCVGVGETPKTVEPIEAWVDRGEKKMSVIFYDRLFRCQEVIPLHFEAGRI